MPDSLPYSRGALADAALSVSVLLCGSGETGAHRRCRGVPDDRSGAPTWIRIHVQGHLGWPAGVGDWVVALTPPDAAP